MTKTKVVIIMFVERKLKNVKYTIYSKSISLLLPELLRFSKSIKKLMKKLKEPGKIIVNRSISTDEIS